MNNIKLNINNIYNPISFTGVLNNKYEKIHILLYKTALFNYFDYIIRTELGDDKDDITKYNEKLNELLQNNKWVEIDRHKDYKEPTKVLRISKNKPFTKEKIDLTKYWNNEYLVKYDTQLENLLFTQNNENLINSEIEYYDYINERVQLGNKFTNDKIIINFKDLNNATQNKIKPNKNLFYSKYNITNINNI